MNTKTCNKTGWSLWGCLVLLLGLAALPLAAPPADGMPATLRWLGSFHLVLLHFPIALLALALVLELAQRPGPRRWLPAAPAPVTTFVLGAGALSACAAVVCGWLLSFEGGYAPDLLQRHFYLGLAGAAGGLLALAAKLVSNRHPEAALPRWVTLALLIVTNLLVLFAGHHGGSLTHGEGYLTERAPAPLRRWLGLPQEGRGSNSAGPIEGREVFAGVILPILQERCVMCHGGTKAKGDLRLDSHASILAAGDGTVVVAGQPEASKLIKALKLPLEDDDHMPPKGKPQLTPEQIALLSWWVETGAKEKAKIKDLNPPPHLLEAMRRQPPPSPAPSPSP